MTKTQNWRSVEEVYGEAFLEEEAFGQALDQSLEPRGLELLFDLVAALDPAPGSLALDVGCREAWHSIELARRFGVQVHGVDPVERHVAGAATALERLAQTEPEVAALVRADLGRAESLPADDDSVALIWCRDVLIHIEDLSAVFGEFRRVLCSEGHVVIYQMMATDWLQPAEAERLWPPVAIVADNTDPQYFESALTGAGLAVEQRIELQGEWRERLEEDGVGMTSRQLLQASRLLRRRAQFEERFGADACNAMLSDCLWGVYQMIGKLSPRVYVLGPQQ